MIIVGVTGQPSSGKDSVANYLISLGYFHVSTSDLIREEMGRLGISIERSKMREFATNAGKERGAGYLAELAINKITGEGVERAIVSGLRRPAEVEALREAYAGNFKLIAVEAPIENRYKWASGRKRVGDEISFEQFKAEEEAERKGSEGAQQVDKVVKMADDVILNNGTKEELFSKVDEILNKLS